MALPIPGRDVDADARRVYECVRDGGVAIIHLDVAYAVLGRTEESVRRIYGAKSRSYGKPTGIVANQKLQDELHILGELQRTMIRSITQKHDLPLAVIAPYRKDHPMLAGMPPFVLKNATKGDTLNILLNAGTLREKIADLAVEEGVLFVGSSANASLTGSKYRLEDIDEVVRKAADVEIDYGTSKYINPQGRSSTMIDFSDYRVQRVGVCFDEIARVMKDEFSITLEPPA